MSSMRDAVKSVIRIEKETYDLYRLLDAATLDDDARTMLDRCAADASDNLRILEEKSWDMDPYLGKFMQHFITEIEFVDDRGDEASLLRSIIENRKKVHVLYTDL